MTVTIKPELEALAVPVGDVKHLPGNAVVHDLEDLKASLTEFGQYRPIIANRRTGHIIKGNGTYAACVALGAERIAVSWVDVDPKDEKRKALVDNRASELGWMNDALLLEALGSLDSLDGTGYEPSFVEGLEKALGTPLNLDHVSDSEGEPAPGPDTITDTRSRYEAAPMRQLVLVTLPGEYDQLLADLDSLCQEGENVAGVVQRLVREAVAARAEG